VTFLADPDGISNLYRMPIDGGPVTRVSSFLTGVAGITSSSPALSMASASGAWRSACSKTTGHSIYVLDEADIRQTVAPPPRRAALLRSRHADRRRQSLLTDFKRGCGVQRRRARAVPRPPHDARHDQPADVQRRLSSFGADISGGISASFSDMLATGSCRCRCRRPARSGHRRADHLHQQAASLELASPARSCPMISGFVTLVTDPVTNQTLLTEVLDRQTSRGGWATVSIR
jgi:hypothetical protein